jgi:hypothetical protein
MKTNQITSISLEQCDLIDEVINQIKNDFEIGDYTAIVELLNSAPRQNLMAYLPSEDQ